jgi:two-component system nitrate/nitrite response regulator NarL
LLTKAATLTAIYDAIAAVARGETVLAPEVQSGLVSELRAREQPQRSFLSEREMQVLRLSADGLTGPEIGARLYISSSTVKTHVKSLLEKLEVSDRAAAVAEAMRRGLIDWVRAGISDRIGAVGRRAGRRGRTAAGRLGGGPAGAAG